MKHITPTARLVLPADATRDAWLGERRHGITATDIPAILGLSKYKTAIDVWMSKVTPDQVDDFTPAIGDGEAALWGTVFEDPVAQTWAKHKGFQVRRIGIIAHVENDWMRASLDRMVTGCPAGRCALEVKTRSGYVGDEWDRGVPADVAAQVHWQLIVSGLDHIHVIALIGGQRLVEHTLYLEEVDCQAIIQAATTVWESVSTGEAPRLPEALWTDDYLEQLHPERDGAAEVPDEIREAAENYQGVIDLIRDLEDRKAELRTILVGALGEHESATWNGRTVYTYKSSTTRRLDSKALAELHPDAAGDDRVYNTTTSRILRLTSKGTK